MKTKYLLPAILLASSSYLANAQSPQSDTISGKTKQELIKNISITETINHDSIIKTPIDTIINMYGLTTGREIIRLHFLIELNKARAKLGIHPLKNDSALHRIAQAHSDDMINKEYYSHQDKNGKDGIWRMGNNGYDFEIGHAAENIAYGDTTIQNIFEGRMNSERHRKNFEDSAFYDIGLGLAKGNIKEATHNHKTRIVDYKNVRVRTANLGKKANRKK